jgi:hypothetical protein
LPNSARTNCLTRSQIRTQGDAHQGDAAEAQTAVNEQQVILAAEIMVDAADFGHLEPIVSSALANLERHGVTEQPGAVLADAGYWQTRQIQQLTAVGLMCWSRRMARCKHHKLLRPPVGGAPPAMRRIGSRWHCCPKREPGPRGRISCRLAG